MSLCRPANGGAPIPAAKTAFRIGARTIGYLSRKPFQSSDQKKISKALFDQKRGEILFQGLSALKGTALKIAQMLSLELGHFSARHAPGTGQILPSGAAHEPRPGAKSHCQQFGPAA